MKKGRKKQNIKTEDIKTEDIKAENVKTEDIKTEDIKAENVIIIPEEVEIKFTKLLNELSLEEKEWIRKTSDDTFINSFKLMIECKKKIESSDNYLRSLITDEIRFLEKQKEKVSSVEKGKIGEEFLIELFKARGYEAINMSKKNHSGDISINTSNGNILVEVKNYKTSIPQQQLVKFYNDLEITHTSAGLFISLDAPIPYKPVIVREIKLINGLHIPIILINTSNSDLICMCIEILIYDLKNINFNKNSINTQNIESNIEQISQLLPTINLLQKDIQQTIQITTDNLNKIRDELIRLELILSQKIKNITTEYKKSETLNM